MIAARYWALTLVSLMGQVATTVGGETTSVQRSRVPVVIKAAVPIYPEALRKGHFEGNVVLGVTTDGQTVVSIRVLSGQGLLADAAKANLDTWVFRQHEATSFNVTFKYLLLNSTCDSKCNCSSKDSPYVLLHLPLNAEIASEEAPICDPSETTYK